ncbi:tetratricopeptide repeat protein [Ferrovibrio sp. MS7]|uniref:tetratricopeptide repeat protein n=1 Tax=Ferrovibrio plantarum TaxID=3119164 RepID=UPI00313624BC
MRPAEAKVTPCARRIHGLASPGTKSWAKQRAALAVMLAPLLLSACVTARAPQPVPVDVAVAEESDMLSPYGHFLAARHARLSFDYTAAADYYLKALSEEPNSGLLAQGAFLSLLADGRVPQALELAPVLRDNNPADHMARISVATGAMLRRDYDSALRVVAEGPTSGIHAAFNPLIAAWAYAGKGEADRALEALGRLDRNPLFGGVHDHLKPMLLELLGRYREAEADYREAMAKPERVGIRMSDAYARFLERRGRADEARALIASQLKLNPDNGTLMRAERRLRSSNSLGSNVAPMIGNANEGFAESLLAAATAFGRNDGGELTELHLQLALALRPDLDDARVTLADIYESRKQWDRAIKTYGTVQSDGAFADVAQLRIAWCMNERGDHDAAVRMLRKIARDRRDDARPLITLGDLYRQMERWQEAATEYTAAFQRIPVLENRHWILLFSRGIAYERSKQWSKAEADMLKALEFQPEQPMVLNYLGYTWIDMNRNIDRATDMIRRAVTMRPNDGAIVDSLGWAYYRVGRYDEAVVQLERAVELKGGDPVITDHLGDAYWKVGRRAEAQFQWRRALGLKPEPELEQQIRRKLETGLDPVAQK